MPKRSLNPVVARRLQKLDEAAGADLRVLREGTEESLATASDYFGHDKNWLGKVERGENRVMLTDYLLLVDRLREANPAHPAVALYDYLNRKGH